VIIAYLCDRVAKREQQQERK